MRRIPTVATVRTVFATVCVIFGMSPGVGGMTLENEKLQILFAGPEDGCAVTGIVNRLSGEARFVTGETKPWTVNFISHEADLWCLEVAHTNFAAGRKSRLLSNRSKARRIRTERKDDGLRLVFEGVELEDGELDVCVEVELPRSSSESLWRISVESRSKSWSVINTMFPTLRGVARNGEANVLEPGGYLGWRLRERYVGSDFKPTSKYFSQGSPMVTAYLKGENGLLFAAHNDRVVMSKLLFDGEQNLAFYSPNEDADVAAKKCGLGYPVAITAFLGDWMVAAKTYRTWATNQVWCSKGKKINREQTSRKFAETALWFRPCNWGLTTPVDETADHLREVAKRWAGLPVGVHWYGWQAHPFNDGYPDYFPPKKGATNVVALAKRLGFRLMPYMNVLRWDTTSVGYRVLAKAGACRHLNGEAQTESFNPSYHQLALMCPSVPFWGEAVNLFLDRAVKELGANMIYMDELGLQHPGPCYARNHPHSMGGGSWYYDGYHAIVRRFREAHPDIPITTEGANEHWHDVVDGYLIAVPTADDVLPFYPAVYSDFASYFGSPLNKNAKIEGFRAYEAQQFVWGIQLGWMRYEPTFGKGREAFGAWMRTLGEARVRYRDFLAYGELIGELRAEDVESATVEWPRYESSVRTETYRKTMPAVVGAWWRTPDGRRTALVAVNHTERAQTFVYVSNCGAKRRTEIAPLSVAVIEE